MAYPKNYCPKCRCSRAAVINTRVFDNIKRKKRHKIDGPTYVIRVWEKEPDYWQWKSAPVYKELKNYLYKKYKDLASLKYTLRKEASNIENNPILQKDNPYIKISQNGLIAYESPLISLDVDKIKWPV